MIQIKKSNAPVILVKNKAGSNKLTEATVEVKKLYDSDKKGFDSGKYIFDFDSNTYAHNDIKTALLNSQHGKCVFCESKIDHVDYGAVEHFRPKAGYKQKLKDDLQRPGYYWLAYEWDNLFYSCTICNEQYKKNLFPLKNPGMRAKNHHDDITKEKPYYPDPSKEDPKNLIGFRGPNIYGKDKLGRGKKTINELGLERNDYGDLTEVRRDVLKPILFTYKVSKLTKPIPGITMADINEAKALMIYCRSAKHQFSSMIQDNCP